MTHIVVKPEGKDEFGVFLGPGWVTAIMGRLGDDVVRLVTAPTSLEGNTSFEYGMDYIGAFEVKYSKELEFRALVMGEVPFVPVNSELF